MCLYRIERSQPPSVITIALAIYYYYRKTEGGVCEGKGTYVLPVTQSADHQNDKHQDGQYSGLSMFQQL